MPGPALITVIIISYNTSAITLKCLRHLYDGTRIPLEVLVVDNASTDGSVQAICQEFPEVHLIRNDRNVGFSTGNNQAMRIARGEYFLLLNSDAYLHPGAIEKMVEYLQAHPEAGVAGPRLLNADGSLQRSCYHFPSPKRAWIENLGIAAVLPGYAMNDYRNWSHDQERFVDFVSGACMLVRRTVYEQIGGFDELFFMYAEETDWQRRMRSHGWLTGFTPAAVATHLGGASGGAAVIRRRVFDSLDRYQCKHHGLAGLLSLRLAMAVGSLLRAGVWALVLVAWPGRRRYAFSKFKLAAWLLLRQTTHWRGVLTK